jgi:hypothetical protein
VINLFQEESIMKKNVHNLIGLAMLGSVFTLVSCATLIDKYLEPDRGATPPLRWDLGAYTNEWGDKTGDYYTQYAGTVKALMSGGGGWDNEETNITELVFSKAEGLGFHIPTAWAPLSARSVEVIVRSGDGNEDKFEGRYRGATNGRNIIVPFSDELLNALIGEERIIRLSAGNYRYQFAFPSQFPEAWEVLQNRQNSAQ